MELQRQPGSGRNLVDDLATQLIANVDAGLEVHWTMHSHRVQRSVLRQVNETRSDITIWHGHRDGRIAYENTFESIATGIHAVPRRTEQISGGAVTP